jgi:hypothetical protein
MHEGALYLQTKLGYLLNIFPKVYVFQEVTMRCRLSWLTNNALV